MNRPFLILSVDTPWVYALAQNLVESTPVTAMRFYDFLNYRRLKPVWPEVASAVTRRQVVMPQGYAGILEPVFRPLMRHLIKREWIKLRDQTSLEPIVIVTYPYIASWVSFINSNSLIYYNLDNYELYNPPRALQIRAKEALLISQSRVTLCLSAYQTERLSRRQPIYRQKIKHFPLGVKDEFVNTEPHSAPIPKTVGYVGNLGERVDWSLVCAVADRLPDVNFHFVGFLVGPTDIRQMSPWQRERYKALKRPNVVCEGGVPQEVVPKYYRKYAVNWMPYLADHPFNLASCPTKIMDSIASGRPFVSTPIPEVSLYPEYIKTAADPEGLSIKIREVLQVSGDPFARVEFAKANCWKERANCLIQYINDDIFPAYENSGNPSVIPKRS